MTNFGKRVAGSLAAAALVAGLFACGAPVPFEASGTANAPQPVEQPTEQEQTKEDSAAKKDVATNDVAGAPSMTTEMYAPSVSDEGLAAEADAYGMPMPDYNTEEYSSVEESGFVSTLANPLSTVSADVDTASYANLRRMLKDGYTVQKPADDKAKTDDANADKTKDGQAEVVDEPEPYPYDYDYNVIPTGAVRIEEMLNYFDYAYPTPSDGQAFSMTASMGKCPWNEDTNLLVLGFATAPEDKSVAEKGSNLVFLIDVSGSMNTPDKLELLKESFEKLVDTLDDNDSVSIVTYSGSEEVVLDGENGANHREILKAVRSLKAGGSTNGEAGLRMAYELAEKHFIKGGANRIVMASDGDLNVGMTSESDLHDFVDKQRETGVYLSVLGFGDGNYKDTKMETLADHGNGSYHYIDCEEEAERVFGSRLTANLVPFADDVKVQVEFNPAQIKGYRLIGYENRTMAAEDFKNDEKDAGEVGPASQFTVAYEVVPTSSKMDIATPDLKYDKDEATKEATDEWLTAKLRYAPVDGGDVKEQELVVKKDELKEDPGEDWRFAAAVTEFGMILRDSEHKGSSTYDSIRTLVGDTKDEMRQDFLDLVDMAEDN